MPKLVADSAGTTVYEPRSFSDGRCVDESTAKDLNKLASQDGYISRITDTAYAALAPREYIKAVYQSTTFI